MPPKENLERACEECIHFFACSRQCGDPMAQRSATGCECYEAVKSSMAYYVGTLDGAKGKIPNRLRELAEADKDGRVAVLAPEERTLDFPVKYTEICELYHFCVDLGIKCTIERLYDGYAVRFPDGSDFAQHHGTYGGTEGCVEPAIGDSEFDYTAVGLNFAKELVKKHKGKLEGKKDGKT